MTIPPVNVGNAATVNDNANVKAYVSSGSFTLSSSTVCNMPAGTYYFTDFSMSGSSTLNVTGAVTIYVTGTFDTSGTITTAANRPSNLKLRITSSSNAKLSGGGVYYMDLYAPNAPVLLSGGSVFFGSVVGGTLTDSGDAIHYDTALGAASAAGGGNYTPVSGSYVEVAAH